MSRTRLLPPVMLLVSACLGEPEIVYVPSDTFREELNVTARRGMLVTVSVGDTVRLHAQRRSGPWRAAEAREVPEGGCSLPTIPPQLEAEVAGDVRWHIEPAGAASLAEPERADRPREVRFDRPGVYRITADTPSWCGGSIAGDTIVVTVLP